MRFIFSLIIVLSLLIAPLAALAAGSCDSANCISFDMGKDTKKSKSDSKSSAKMDHCCVHSHAMSNLPLVGISSHEPASNKLPLLKDAVLLGQDADGLLRPPKAA